MAATDQFTVMDFPKPGGPNTVSIQKQYGAKLRGRFDAINAEARRGIIERDIFGLTDSGSEQLASSDFDPDNLTPEGFPSKGNQPRTQEFMQWLRRQYAAGVLSVIETDSNTYIKRAYEQGTSFAAKQLRDVGVDVEVGTDGLDASTGPRGGAAVGGTFNAPVRADILDTLYSRNYDQLEGITEDHANKINRILTSAFLEGKNPRTIGTEITKATNTAKHRVTALARYEVMYAANLSSLESYEEMGVSKVDILTTAPCESCAAIEADAPYDLSEVWGLLPDHPNCMCSVSPHIDG